MGEFKIEKGVPIPTHNGGASPKYPFREMEVGDSILLLSKDKAKYTGLANGWARSTGWKFSSRFVEGGRRIWRIK